MFYDFEVALGVMWLNENAPADWWDLVNLDTLNLGNGFDCVLGQVFTAHADETGILCGYFYAVENFDINVQARGFCEKGYYNDHELDYRLLKKAWVKQITELRSLVNA